ncbi:type I restriction-modification system DNA methylase [Tolypothrix tenuis PCC 7101]|uniref:Type I restriction-modification system DNA methylase n=1 Tax=Tolypothrix tenuis PCC 7101 TaxID=231146 RepID=A0A1Z4N722_9CYAN|nr:type I restriction-modification system DNA methylase [Tolypothrix tenuis PCC 7101]BAZ74558.1 type I restriction-modification system DNA methylase [Aulosira laxa NIES-50]
MPANTTDLEKRLWEAVDELRANSKLKSSEYSIPVLGLIFLRYADWKFTHAEEELKNAGSRRRGITKADYQAKGVMYLPDAACPKKLFVGRVNPSVGEAWVEACL